VRAAVPNAMSNTHPHRRRGIAMMLVLVSVAVAMILASSYLVSRDNSLAISHNSVAATQARWAAMSGLETAVAILQTETDWRLKSDGLLVDHYQVAGATLTITALDIETNQAPTADSEYFRIRATAEVDLDNDGTFDGRQSTVFLAYVPVITRPHVAVGLNEFAIFARDSFKMYGDSTVARWPTAPLGKLGRRINIATHAQGSGDILITDNAACVDCTVYHSNTASGTLVNDTNGPAVARESLSFDIPFPGVPDHGEPNSAGGSDTTINGTTVTASTSDRFDDIVVKNGAQWTLQGDITIVAEHNLKVTAGSTVVIDGNVTLVIFNDLFVTTSAIEVTPGSTLTVYVGDDMELTDGYIGEVRSDDIRDNSGNEQYMDPLDIRFYTIETTPEIRLWKLRANSVVKGSFHGETLRLTINQDSAVYGRIAGKTLTISDNGALFYDPALDTRVGYTNRESGLFTITDGLATAFSLGFSLDFGSLLALADMTGTVIQANGEIAVPTIPFTPPAPGGAGDPTPRPVPVEYTLVTFGPDMTRWEHPGSDESGGGGGQAGGGTSLFDPDGGIASGAGG